MSELLNELRSRTDSKAVHGTLPFLEDYLGTMLEDATHIPQWVHDIMLHEALKPSRACLIESLHGLLMDAARRQIYQRSPPRCASCGASPTWS